MPRSEIGVENVTRGEVCLGAGKASRLSGPVPPTARFDRLLPALGEICGCPFRSKGAILALRLAEIWRKSLEMLERSRLIYSDRV
jgi:hypothetical protein